MRKYEVRCQITKQRLSSHDTMENAWKAFMKRSNNGLCVEIRNGETGEIVK